MKQERNIIDNILKHIKGETIKEATEFIISNAYLYLEKNKRIDSYGLYDLVTIAEEMNQHYPKELIDRYNGYLDNLSIEEIKGIIYFCLSGKTIKPKSLMQYSNNKLCELVISLLKINSSDNVVLDLGSGTGNFLANVNKYMIKKGIFLKDLFGIESNASQVYLSNMAMQIIRCSESHPYIIWDKDLENSDIQYTHAYVFPPLGARFNSFEKIISSKYLGVKFSSRNSTEWIFVDRILRGNPQRSIALTTIKALYNDADKEYRNKIIEDGLLEGIIELPSGALDFTGIKTCLLVFSQGNKKVRFVDASSVFDKATDRLNKTELPIEQILSLYNDKNVETKTIEEAIKCNNLVPSNALIKVENQLNSFQLSTEAEVFTGSQYTARDFAKFFTDRDTGYRILTSSDIEDGHVNWNNLQRIDYKDEKFDKYAVQKNDVIVTSKSSKVKTVVVDIEPKEKVLVTGGMIIIRPNTNRLDPTFLKIYLDSKQGQLALKQIKKGAIITTINAKDLLNILIPFVDINKQREKAKLYNEHLSSLLAYKNEISKIENRLTNFYLDEFEGE